MGVFSGISQAYSILCLRTILFQVTLLIVMAMFVSANSSRDTVKMSAEEEAALKNVLRGTNKFAIDLYTALSNSRSGNVFVSPISAQIVLAQAYIGAKESTADGLAKLLSLPENLDDTLVGYNSLIRVLKDPVLNIANRIFVESSANVKDEFQKKIEKYFLALAEALDFKSNAESSRIRINNWVEEQTNKKITNLLPPNSVTSDTRLVLTNAIHFKANWEKRFQEKNTKEQQFYVSKTKTVPVQMMNTKGDFAYSYNEALGAKMLGMNYEGGNFRMVIILPDEIDGLASVETKLANVELAEAIKGLQGRTEVQVALPKFKLEETMVLNDILISLGAEAMFSAEQANFSGITDEGLVVSLVVQKSFVEVNEKGTEAAAATGVVMMLKCSIKPPPAIFTADHPFIFLIYHANSETPLFIGRYALP